MRTYFIKGLKWFSILLSIIISLIIILSIYVYYKKDYLVDQVLKHANEDFKGHVQIENVTISPFENFPYISIKLDHLKVFE